MRDDLRLLLLARCLGRLVLRKITQNLAIAIGSKVAVTCAAFYGYTWLWLAIAGVFVTNIVKRLYNLTWEAC